MNEKEWLEHLNNSNKNRLKMIKNNKDLLLDLEENGDIDWLIEQAERAQSLNNYKESYDGLIGAFDNMTKMALELKYENKRYRELLNGIKQAHAYGSGCIESFIHEFEQEEDDEEYRIEVSG